MKIILNVIYILIIVTSCNQPKELSEDRKAFAISKTNSEWQRILNPEAYEVMVKGGTEPPFNNLYDKNSQEGIYVSAASGEPLFSSKDKFDSGTGWPSFTKPIHDSAVTIIRDNSLGLSGEEVIETKTGLHLGHVFNDGPPDKGGKRYCMNSAALKFIKK